MIIYIVFLLLLLIFFITTFHYKKKEYSNIPKKEHPLAFLYGSSFFIITIFDRYINKGKISGKDLRKSEKLSKLYVGVNPRRLLMLHKAKSISFSLLSLLVILIISVLYHLNDSNNTNTVSSLDRPTDSNSSSINLTIDYEGETTDIIIEIESQAHTLEEALKYFDEHRSEIEKSMLGDNEDLYNINSTLKFNNKVAEIQILWQPEEPKYVDYSGDILFDNIPDQGILTNIIATLTYGGHEAAITIPIFIPSKASTFSILDEINNEIVSINDPYSSNVNLPTSINGSEIKYYSSANEFHINFF